MEVCRRDILFWVNTFVCIPEPRLAPPHNVLPFITFPMQDEAFLAMQRTYRRADYAIKKSRDTGASMCAMADNDHHFLFEKRQSIGVMSSTEEKCDWSGSTDTLFAKLDFFHEHLPSWMRPEEVLSGGMTRGKREVFNPWTKSVINGAAGTKKAFRGGRRARIYIDELGEYQVAEASALQSSLFAAARSRLYTSTPSGMGHPFADLFFRDVPIQSLDFHWSEHPFQRRGLYRNSVEGGLELLDKAYWATATVRSIRVQFDLVAARIDEDVPDEALAVGYYPFQQDAQYPKRSPYRDQEGWRLGIESQVAQELEIDFLQAGSPVFKPEVVNECLRRATPPVARGELLIHEHSCEPLGFEERQAGAFSLWFEPAAGVSLGRRYILGIDISSGTSASNSCIGVFDVVARKKVAAFVTPTLAPHQFARHAVAIAIWFNRAKMIWDGQGGTGHGFSRAVAELRYSNVYYHGEEETKKSRWSKGKAGYFVNAPMKQTLLQEYAGAIEAGELTNPDAESLRECFEYRWQPGGMIAHMKALTVKDPSGAKAQHGDRLFGDALGYRLVLLIVGRGIPTETNPVAPEGSPRWRYEQRIQERRQGSRTRTWSGRRWRRRMTRMRVEL